MHTILGAGGAIGSELIRVLADRGHRVRLVGRNPKPAGGTAELISADVSRLDQTIAAVSGSSVVYLVVGLKYDLQVWRELWPRIMNNAIEACKRTQARLIFFDNVYAYGKVSRHMTEDSPFNPCSRKGEIRAQIATTLINEIKAGNLNALIARSADFYGPRANTSVLNILVFDRFARGTKAMWLLNDRVPHSFTYTPDAAISLVLLADAESAWNQTWHVPTASHPPSGREIIPWVAQAFGVEPRYRLLRRPVIKLGGLFAADLRESYEMLYQNDSPYVLDSSKFSKAFSFAPTPYSEGIRYTAAAYNLPAT